jgi:hypothetical protein
MSADDLPRLTTEQLIARFVQISSAQDDALLYEDIDKFNRLFDEKTAILEELKARPGDQRRMLLELYSHPNMQVRLNAVKATLAIAPAIARGALEEIRSRKDVPQGGDAGMTIRALESGVFKPT